MTKETQRTYKPGSLGDLIDKLELNQSLIFKRSNFNELVLIMVEIEYLTNRPERKLTLQIEAGTITVTRIP